MRYHTEVVCRASEMKNTSNFKPGTITPKTNFSIMFSGYRISDKAKVNHFLSKEK
jgi:hypothetical protein